MRLFVLLVILACGGPVRQRSRDTRPPELVKAMERMRQKQEAQAQANHEAKAQAMRVRRAEHAAAESTRRRVEDEKRRLREAEDQRLREEKRRQQEEANAEAAKTWADYERKSADPSFRSAVGYGSTRWGMTMGEVKRIERGGRKEAGLGYVVRRKIGHWDVEAGFVFAENRLVQVVVALPQRINTIEAVEDYERIVELLIEKYEAPHQTDGGEDYKASYLAPRIVLGEIELFSIWEWIDERIQVSCTKARLGSRTLIFYSSMELLPLAKRYLDAQKTEALRGL